MYKAISLLPSKILVFSTLLTFALVTGCSNISKIEDKPYFSSTIEAAGGLGSYSKYSAVELLRWSDLSPSFAEKLQIRAYLKENHPNTAAGLYSRAYLAEQNGLISLERDLAKKLLDLHPNNPITWFYHSFDKNIDTQIKMVMKGIEAQSEYRNYRFFIRLSDIYVDEKDKINSDDLLTVISKYEKKLGKDIFVFDYVRGIIEHKIKGNTERANHYYESALSKVNSEKKWSLWTRYFDNKYGENGLVTDNNSRDYLDDLSEAMSNIKKSSMSKLDKSILEHRLITDLIADKARDEGRNSFALKVYRQANYYYFTSEVATKVRSILVEMKRDQETTEYLSDVAKKLSTNPDALGMYAAELAYKHKYKNAEYYFKLALKNSQNPTDKNHYRGQYISNVLYPTFRANEAVKLLLKSNLKSGYARMALVQAYVYAGEYQLAQENINKINILLKDNKNIWPNKLDEIVADYIKRESKPQKNIGIKVLATTSATEDWIIVHPDGKTFFGSNGSSTYWQWNIDSLTVTNKFDGAIIDTDYAKDMIRPVFSPNGDYFAYTTHFEGNAGNVMIVYGLKEQRVVRQLSMIKKNTALAWSPDGSEIALWNYGRLIKYSFTNDKVIQQQAVKDNTHSDGMLWTADGEYIALLERRSDGFVRIYDADSFEPVTRLTQVSWPHALGASTDGRYIFSADNHRILHKWDMQNNFSHSSIEIPVLGRIISAHPTEPKIIINDWGGRNKLISVDYVAMKIVAKKRTGTAELRAFYIADGQKLVASNVQDNKIEVFDAETLERLHSYEGESVETKGLYANPEDNQIVSWDKDGLHIWSINKGKKLKYWPGTFQSVLSDPKSKNKLYGLIKGGKLKVSSLWAFNLTTMTKELIATPNFEINKWGFESGNLILAGHYFIEMDKGIDEGVVLVVDVEKETYKQVAVPMITDVLKYPRLSGSRFVNVAISPNHRYVAVSTAWKDGWKQAETKSAITRVYDVETSKLVTTIKQVGELSFKNNDLLAISEGDDLSKESPVFSIKSGKKSGVLGRIVREQNISAHESFDNDISLPKKNLKIEITKDNLIQFYNYKNGKLVLTILSKRENEWLAYLPSGKFSSSKNGNNKVTWLDGGVQLPNEKVESLRQQGLIEAQLKMLINK